MKNEAPQSEASIDRPFGVGESADCPVPHSHIVWRKTIMKTTAVDPDDLKSTTDIMLTLYFAFCNDLIHKTICFCYI